MLDALHFLRPAWLLALLPLLVAIIWLLRRRPGLRRWANIVDAHLAPHVLVGSRTNASRLPALITAVAGSLAIIALAGPAWQQLPQPVFSSQNALVILLDLSSSMNTEDIKPSRMDRARFKVADLLEQRKEGQTALVVYAAGSYIVSPLTDDVSTITAQLSALAPELMPSQGSRADIALDRAYELLQQAGRKSGDVLLVTDGVDVARAQSSISKLVESGYRISVLGVGTAEGGPIPAADGFLRKRDGAIVVARLDRNALRTFATEGGGIYQDLSADSRDIDRFTGLLDNTVPTQTSQRDLTADIWREEGPWLVLLVLPIAALVFRRGILAAVALAFMLPINPADAADLSHWWKTPDQRAAQALAERNAAKAADLFRDPAWKGAANYRAGNYEGALQALANLDTIDAAYNRANALARLGRLEEAVAAYDEVLEREPQHTDAQFNRQLLLEQMQNEAEQSESDDSAEQDDQGEQQESEQNNDEQQSGEEQDGESGQQQAEQGENQDAEESSSESADDSEPTELTEEQKQALAEESEDDTEEDDPAQSPELVASDELPDEEQQAIEQWLRRIPDDPGGLLRRKFLNQYQRQKQPAAEEEPW